MIVYALIVRTTDGMALSATTDFNDEVNTNIKDSKRYVKMLAKKALNFPDRCILNLNSYTIYVITSLGLSYLALCETSYPTVLAFSFLNELMKEFITKYETVRVNQARRPYTFIEFDNFIHKTRQRYNKPQNLTTKINLSDLSTEIRLRPPHIIQLSQVEPVSNGYQTNVSLNLMKLSVGPPLKLEPLATYGIVATVLTVFLAFIDLYRGISALSESSIEEYDGPSPVHGFVFLCESLIRGFQVYLLLQHSRYRLVESWVSVAALCMMSLGLWELRDTWHVLVNVCSAGGMHTCTMLRRLEPKLPNYNV